MKEALYQPVFRWWDYPLFTMLTVVNGGMIIWFLQHWFSLADWQSYPWIYLIITGLLVIIWTNYWGRWFLLLQMRRPVPVPAPSGLRVAVVTTFVPGAEPLAMLEHTVRALVSLDYPHDTWVLDEGDDGRVKAMCRKLGARHFSRKCLPHYQMERGLFQSRSKHGNYNAWLYEIGFERYDVVSAFDPDHVPRKDFLDNVLGYFKEPQIGYVQVAPAYYNQEASFIARGAAEETYSYFSSLQMAGHALGYPVVIGSHNTHRVEALKAVGGFAPHDADDLLITLLYRSKGWQGVYVPKILARGLAPVDWPGYITQQRRWARSVLDVKVRQYFRHSANLPWPSRILGFLHGLNYLHRSIVIFVSLLLLGSLLATGLSPLAFSYETVWKVILVGLVLQASEFYRQRFYLDWRNEMGWHWRVGVLQFAVWPYFLFAFLEVVFGKPREYLLTNKVETKKKPYLLFWPHFLTALFVGTAWMSGWLTKGSLAPALQVVAGGVIVASIALILSSFMRFPPPFEMYFLQKFLGARTNGDLSKKKVQTKMSAVHMG